VGRDNLLSERRPCGHMGASHSSGAVPFARGIHFEGRMQDGTVTTKSSLGKMGSVSRTLAGSHSGMGTGVHALQSCSIYSYSRVLGHGQSLEDMFAPHVLGFLPPPIGECVVSRGCSRSEERGSIYLVDPIVIIEVRREEVLASTLDRSRLWRRGPGSPGGPNCVGSFVDRELDGDTLFILCCCCIGNQSRFLVSFSPFR
jgi:hypothetical protein